MVFDVLSKELVFQESGASRYGDVSKQRPDHDFVRSIAKRGTPPPQNPPAAKKGYSTW